MTRALNDYLREDSAAGHVLAHARLLNRLGQRLAASLPGPLAQHAHLANFKQGIAVIHADNGAIAAKLRQLGQRLARELSNGQIECLGIEVKVLPQQPLRHEHSAQIKPLSAKSGEILQSTVTNLPAGPLRQALEMLLSRAARQP